MALITCPECNASISSEAKACPHCGFPLTDAGTSNPLPMQNAPTSANEVPKKKVGKGIIALIAVIVIAAAVGAYFLLNRSGAANIATAVHATTGDAIAIGMEKDAVEDLIGKPMIDEIYSIYDDSLTLTYDRGKLVRISWDGSLSSWETEAEIRIGSSLDDVFQAYGEEDLHSAAELMEYIKEDTSEEIWNYMEQTAFDYENYLTYYFSSTGKKLDDMASAAYTLSFDLDAENRVVGISISEGL